MSSGLPRLLAPGSLLLALVFFAGCATAPSAYVEPAPLAASDRHALNVQVFDAVQKLVAEKHYDPKLHGVNWPALGAQYRPAAEAAANDAELYRVLGQMCGELHESHLNPLPPRRTHELKTASRMAVGMGWATIDRRQVITEVIPGGPASEAGVQTGWIVTSCEGHPLGDGPPLSPSQGRPITYGFLDLTNEARAITFQPQLLKFDQLVSRDLPNGYRYLRFDKFDAESLHWLSRELKAHRAAPGVVLDLRNNPGGYIYSASMAIGEFFPHRVDFGEVTKRNGTTKEAHGWPIFSAHYAGKVAILTSPATGSAAEIFSHVLQYERRATVIGRRTAGAVEISRMFNLPGGGTLQVPIQDYRGRDGRRLEGRGVLPDIAVAAPALADLRGGRDLDLETAITSLTSRPKGVLTASK